VGLIFSKGARYGLFAAGDTLLQLLSLSRAGGRRMTRRGAAVGIGKLSSAFLLTSHLLGHCFSHFSQENPIADPSDTFLGTIGPNKLTF